MRDIVKQVRKYREPEPGEIRLAGYAISSVGGFVTWVPSCAPCANTLGVPWVAALFEGTCSGCEVILSGNQTSG